MLWFFCKCWLVTAINLTAKTPKQHFMVKDRCYWPTVNEPSWFDLFLQAPTLEK